jgi:hypothetical protein
MCAGLALAVMLLLSCGLRAATLDKRPDPADARSGPTRVWMRDVVLYPYDDARSHVVELSGSVVPTHAGGTVVFDDVASYGVEVEHAEMSLTAATMTVLMNRYILPAANGPIRHVDVTFGANTIEMKGTMVKAGLPIPFSASATAAPDPNGDMRIRITKMTAAGIVPKGLMDALGLQMSTVAQPRNTGVFSIKGDDMILPVASMFPPPKFTGRLRSVTITPAEMVGVIGAPGGSAQPGIDAQSYIHYSGGILKFAKLTMQDADLTLIPKSGSGPLGFSPANYYLQMKAGFTVPQPDRGLVAHVPDYPAVDRAAR